MATVTRDWDNKINLSYYLKCQKKVGWGLGNLTMMVVDKEVHGEADHMADNEDLLEYHRFRSARPTVIKIPPTAATLEKRQSTS